MAVAMQNDGTVGCAYYVAIDEILYLQEDIPMAGIDLVETLIIYAQPTTVLVSHHAQDDLIQYLERGVRGVDDGLRAADPHALHSAYALRTTTTAEFKYEGGREKLVNLDLELFEPSQAIIASVVHAEADDQESSSTQTRAMRLGALINLDSRTSIGCAGAVLTDLNRRKAAAVFPDDLNAAMKFRVKSVKMFTLSDSMFINADTLASLQILRSENHPNSQMQGPGKSQSGAKESLSVYGLVQALASTPQGKSKLRQIFLRPSVDLEKIHQRQQTIAVLLNPENAQILDSLSATLKKIKNMRRPILLLHKGVDLPTRHKNVHNSVWLSLFRFAKYAVELRETALSLFKSDQLEICIKVHTPLGPCLFRMGS